MLIKRIYEDSLAQASYLIGCQKTGDAIVIDPNRNVDQYVRAAKSEGLRITQVTETHIHADFVSGARELAERTGAALLLSDEGGDDWRYAYARDAGARLLHDGDVIMVGNIRLDVRHTPGHTPEHLSFIVTDTAATERAMGMVTGDFIFVGDVGRPDLLERAAGVEGSMEAGARTLWNSIQRTKELPDYLQLWPGHGAGSACGKALGAVPSTTLGYERITNWALTSPSEGDFVREVLAGQPEPPRYFADMKRINRDGPASIGEVTRPPHVASDQLADHVRRNALVVDTRPARAFAGRHVAGTVSIPLNKSFSNWMGSLIPFEGEFAIIADEHDVDRATRELAMIGLDGLSGFFTLDAIDACERAGLPMRTTPQMKVAELKVHVQDRDVQLLDVRRQSEWDEGHIPGAIHIPLGSLPERLAVLSPDTPIAINCQGGGRSAIAASLLEAHGFTTVANVAGGYDAWLRAGERGTSD